MSYYGPVLQYDSDEIWMDLCFGQIDERHEYEYLCVVTIGQMPRW